MKRCDRCGGGGREYALSDGERHEFACSACGGAGSVVVTMRMRAAAAFGRAVGAGAGLLWLALTPAHSALQRLRRAARLSVARGTTRRVVLVGSYAMKFPAVSSFRLFLCGLLANMQEVEFSKTGWPELCPVRFSVGGGLLVVMTRARTLTRQEFDSMDMGAWLERGEYRVPAELKADSFGYLGDRLVAVDYGSAA